MDGSLESVYESLSEEQRDHIHSEVRRYVLAREEDRIRRIHEVEIKKQKVLHELEDIDWNTVENDQWFVDAQNGAKKIDQRSIQQHKDIAKELFFRKEQIVKELLPAIDQEMQAVLDTIELEEQQENQSQQLTIERLLEPIRKKEEESVARRKFARWRELQKEKEEEENRAKIDYAALVTRMRSRRLIEEQTKRDETRLRTVKEVRAYAAKRGVEHLVHFTPLDNVGSILVHGLQSRSALRGKQYRITDDYRTDGWLDWISTSISFPNYKMFIKKRDHIRDVSGWVVILIGPEVLWELECKYLLTNASSSEVRTFRGEHWSSSRAFEEMFGQDEFRDNIPSYYTTDPQAEVMVRESVPPSYIRKIIVSDCLQETAMQFATKLPVETNIDFFRWRSDYEVWRKHRLVPQALMKNTKLGD